MPDRAHRDAIVNLEDFLSRPAKRQKEDALVVPNRSDRTAGRELRFNVLAPVGNCLNPAIRLFNHATECRKISAIFSSDKVLMPSPETVLITGKILPLRSTPPVAVSDSAAVSNARSAIVTDSSSLRVCKGRPAHLFS